MPATTTTTTAAAAHGALRSRRSAHAQRSARTQSSSKARSPNRRRSHSSNCWEVSPSQIRRTLNFAAAASSANGSAASAEAEAEAEAASSPAQSAEDANSATDESPPPPPPPPPSASASSGIVVPLGSEDAVRVAAHVMQQCVEWGTLGSSPSEDEFSAINQVDGRVVAVGDVHGDLAQTLRVLKIAGLIEEYVGGAVEWVGGDATLVQMGDVLDRGDFEIALMCLIHSIRKQARDAGGNVFVLTGNHEALNANGDFRYVTRGAFVETCAFAELQKEGKEVEEKKASLLDTLGLMVRAAATGGAGGPPLDPTTALRARINAFAPGGILAREMATYHTALVVNDTVFAHGGLLPMHASYGIDKINQETGRWMRGTRTGDGQAGPPRLAVGGPESVVWTRVYSKERFADPFEEARANELLDNTLSLLKLGSDGRMVVGHTPQMQGVNNQNLGGKLWKVDVGMSSGVLDALPSCLELAPDGEAQVLTNWNPSTSANRTSVSANSEE